MHGHEHYREAERLLNSNIIRADIGEGQHDYAADRPSTSDHSEDDCEGIGNLAAAQVHATLALAAVLAETGIRPDGSHLVLRPSPADDADPAFPGTPWGRALYGDLHLSNDKD